MYFLAAGNIGYLKVFPKSGKIIWLLWLWWDCIKADQWIPPFLWDSSFWGTSLNATEGNELYFNNSPKYRGVLCALSVYLPIPLSRLELLVDIFSILKNRPVHHLSSDVLGLFLEYVYIVKHVYSCLVDMGCFSCLHHFLLSETIVPCLCFGGSFFPHLYASGKSERTEAWASQYIWSP